MTSAARPSAETATAAPTPSPLEPVAGCSSAVHAHVPPAAARSKTAAAPRCAPPRGTPTRMVKPSSVIASDVPKLRLLPASPHASGSMVAASHDAAADARAVTHTLPELLKKGALAASVRPAPSTATAEPSQSPDAVAIGSFAQLHAAADILPPGASQTTTAPPPLPPVAAFVLDAPATSVAPDADSATALPIAGMPVSPAGGAIVAERHHVAPHGV